MIVIKFFAENWKALVEIAVLWYVIYITLLFIKGTRTAQLLKGLAFLFLIFIISDRLGFDVISWVLTRLFALSLIALLVIFQPELRRGLARLGQFGFFQENLEMLEEAGKAAIMLSKRKVGALIAIEREIGLKNYIETGTPVDAKVTKDILMPLFLPDSTIHDGGVIIQGGRIVAAGCLFPLAQITQISKSLGTRHRAAVGLSEETDAVVVVVSEETGGISVAVNGHLARNLTEANLIKFLKGIFYKRIKGREIFGKIFIKIFPKVTEKTK
ncbi:MAG: diadenylate cyclase CdaA [Candidatus Omnitrophota bacterium]